MTAPPTRAESCPATCHMMTDPQPGPIAAQLVLSSYLHTHHCRHAAVLFPVLQCEVAWRSQCVYPQISPVFVLLAAGRPRQCPLVPIVQSNHYHSYQITIHPHSATLPSMLCLPSPCHAQALRVKMVSLFWS